MHKELIAPCGMNCGVCANYLAEQIDLKKKGSHKSYCPGCRPRGKNCLYMSNKCDLVGKGLISFCNDCADFPCLRLKALDKRYRTFYHLSMIENLAFIKEHGMESFLEKEREKWQCPECGGVISCHNGICFSCHPEDLRNRTIIDRWRGKQMPEISDLERRIQVLEDIESIKRLKARYWYCVDNKQWDKLAECYAENADFECPMTGRLEGRNLIVRFLKRVMKDIKTVHQGHSPEIEILTGTTATGKWSLNDRVESSDNRSFRGYGYYEDEYVKVNNTWVIQKSRLTYITTENNLGLQQRKPA